MKNQKWIDLMNSAYEVGSRRGCYQYQVSPDRKTMFAVNPSSPEGMYIQDGKTWFGENPEWESIDLYEARRNA